MEEVDVFNYNSIAVYDEKDLQFVSITKLHKIIQTRFKSKIKNYKRYKKADLIPIFLKAHNKHTEESFQNKAKEKINQSFENQAKTKVITPFCTKQIGKSSINVYGTQENPLFRRNDICILLGIKYFVHTLKVFDKNEFQRLPLLDAMGRVRTHIFLTEQGVRRVLTNSRKPKSLELAKLFGIDVLDHKFVCKETETLQMIMKTFATEVMMTQYAVGNYYVDLYFLHHNICVECDEFGHKERNQSYERKRKEFIDEQLSCKWVRYNPDDENFDMSLVLNEIFKLLTSTVVISI